MNRAVFKLHPSIYLGLFLAFFLANAFAWKSPSLGVILLVAFLVLVGERVGKAAAPDDPSATRLWLGIFQLISALMLVGTATYYVHSFSANAAIALVLLSVPIAYLLAKRSKRDLDAHDLEHEHKHHLPGMTIGAATVALVAFIAVGYLLSASATTQAIASPWRVVPSIAFVVFGLGLLLLSAMWLRGRERALALALTVGALFIFLFVNLAVFPLGAGFDSFIHQTAELHIAQFGSITPKTFYYIGQYVFVTLLNHAFFLPVVLSDRWLLPLLAALLLPFAWLDAAEHLLPERRHGMFTLVGLFLLPIGALATTTPQGLANLWILLLILAAVPFLKRFERPRVYALILPALAAVAIHPLTGLPALLFVAYLACEPAEIPEKLEKIASALRWVILAIGALILPASFLFVSQSQNSGGFDVSNLGQKLLNLIPWPPAYSLPLHPTLDFAVFLSWAAGFIVVALAILGWNRALPRLRQATLAMVGVLFINYLLLATVVDFSFLIDYERMNYTDRLIPLILFFLVPLAILGLGTIRERLAKAPTYLRLFFIALCAATVLGAWYAAYPRDDAYLKGHGYNVSAADFEAVKAIEADAHGDSYIALADQSVSAAAISTIGFRYYGPQFFYPIPTGGDLYQAFLDMNDEPTSAKAVAAIKKVEDGCFAQGGCQSGLINHLYFVVDSYWWNANNIVAEAKTVANKQIEIQNGAVEIFRFDR